MRAGLALALASLTFVPTFAQDAMRADGIAAIVGANTPRADAKIILHSDVDFRARLRLIREAPGQPHLGALPRGLLRATLDELIGEALIAREAERVQVASPTPNDIRRERRRLEQLAGGAESLRTLVNALGATEAELEAMVEQRALVSVFLEANLEGAATVSDARIEAVFESGEHPFLGQSLDDVRGAMRVWLTRQALDQAVTRWIQVLRERTRVREMATY